MKEKRPQFLAYRSFHTPLSTIEKFSDAGYEVACVFPAHTLNSLGEPYSQYPPTWIWFDKIDFVPFDRMVADTTRAMPGAKLILMVDLNSPAWLEHNDWLGSNDTFMNLGKAIHNPKWLTATENYLKAFVSYANEKYGDRIVGYVLACGSTDEWYDYSRGSESSERRVAWRAYQTAKGKPDPIDIPAESKREHFVHEDFLRSPTEDAIALDYWHFCNESVANTIIRFADDVRKIVGDKAEIGCFYGYILEKSANSLVSCGHLDYERVLECPNIDFVISPGTYRDRQIGGGSGFLVPSGTAAVNGKRLLHECDQRTHTYNKYLTPYITLPHQHWENENATVAGIKREAALGLIKRTHLWWFDMWGDFYQGEGVMKTLARVRDLWYKYSPEPAQDVCEVAMIVDPDSTYFVNQNHEMTPKMNLGTRNLLNRLGAPFEVYSFGDIPKIKNFDRYKLVIFTSMFNLTEEKREILNKYVLTGERGVLWLYAPGIITDGVLDTENCERLSGIPYGKEGVTAKKLDGYTSYYVHKYADLTPEILKDIAKKCGVRVTVDAKIPVYAEGNLLAVHTAEGGALSLSVDEKYTEAKELFTGKISEIKGGKFTYEFASPDTALFELK